MTPWKTSSSHPDPVLVARYSSGTCGLDDVTAWALEAHLDRCAACRSVLARALAQGPDAPARGTLADVAAAIGRGIAAGPPPAPLPGRLRRVVGGRAGGSTGAVWAVVPWFLTVVGVLGTAFAAQRAFPAAPSLVLLVSPVAPLLPVAAAWTRGADPAWEVICSTPRAGLGRLLRRALVVLLALAPVLVGAGWGSGSAPGLWLLPGLAFTAGSLALGGLVGIARAAAVLTGVWSAGVIAPSLATQRIPAVLAPGSWTAWAAATAVLLTVTLIRADDHRRLSSRA